MDPMKNVFGRGYGLFVYKQSLKGEQENVDIPMGRAAKLHRLNSLRERKFVMKKVDQIVDKTEIKKQEVKIEVNDQVSHDDKNDKKEDLINNSETDEQFEDAELKKDDHTSKKQSKDDNSMMDHHTSKEKSESKAKSQNDVIIDTIISQFTDVTILNDVNDYKAKLLDMSKERCICDRDVVVLTCRNCRRPFKGRPNVSCNVHKNVIHLMDVMHCPGCRTAI